jgi:hypothetical protein
VDEETRQLQAELAKAEALHAQAIKGGSRQGPARSIEGWVIIACGIHEEAQEDDVYEASNLINSFRVCFIAFFTRFECKIFFSFLLSLVRLGTCT